MVGPVPTSGRQQAILTQVNLLCKEIRVELLLGGSELKAYFLQKESLFDERPQVDRLSTHRVVDDEDRFVVRYFLGLDRVKLGPELCKVLRLFKIEGSLLLGQDRQHIRDIVELPVLTVGLEAVFDFQLPCLECHFSVENTRVEAFIFIRVVFFDLLLYHSLL